MTVGVVSGAVYEASAAHADPDRAGHAGAAEAAIAARILGEILLVIVLGEIERSGLGDLGGDRARARFAFSASP